MSNPYAEALRRNVPETQIFEKAGFLLPDGTLLEYTDHGTEAHKVLKEINPSHVELVDDVLNEEINEREDEDMDTYERNFGHLDDDIFTLLSKSGVARIFEKGSGIALETPITSAQLRTLHEYSPDLRERDIYGGSRENDAAIERALGINRRYWLK